MLTISAINSVEYYIECAADERDRMSYYSDSAGEAPGVWYTPTGWLCQDGSQVSPRDLRDVSDGFPPGGGDRLVQSNSKKRRAAYDLTFSAPKSISALWACGNTDQRGLIEAAHSAAVRAALGKIQELALIETRRGKGGATREQPRDFLASIFDHHTTRAGDPQIHSHVLLMNLCTRQDGTTGGIDSAKLHPMIKSIGAYYRSSLAQNLQGKGLTITQKDDAYTLAGVPDELTAQWSKRRGQIEAVADKMGIDTADDSKLSGLINLSTRATKKDLPTRGEMESIWKLELGMHNLAGADVWREAMGKGEQEQDNKQDDLTPVEAVAQAVAELTETQSVIEFRNILEKTLVLSQGAFNPDEAWGAIEQAEKEGIIVRLNPDDPNTKDEEPAEPIYSTPAIIQAEKKILRIGLARRQEKIFVADVYVRQAIGKANAGGFKLTDQQMAAVKHALNADGVAMIEGHAGTGKSTVFATIADASANAGADIHLIAPSWKATTGAAKDIKRMKQEQARAVQGFIQKAEARRIKVDRRSVILVDEAGMISTRDMQRLMKVADAAGAKIILAGDPSQLAAVQAGDPFSLLVARLGTAKIDKIIRQRVEWMRLASEDFASGDEKRIRKAVAAYYEKGHIRLEDSREAAMAALADEWLSHAVAGEPPGVVASRNADVSALNLTIRARAVEVGLVKGPAVTIKAIGRGKGAKAADLELRAGDKILLGEGLVLRGKAVSNNAILTIVRIDPGPTARVTIRLEDGTIITIPGKDLVGAKGKPLKASYGFACTIHAAQGATWRQSLVFDATNLRSRAAYVAMTRHSESTKVFIDSAAIKAKHTARPEQKLAVGKQGASGFADEHEDDLMADDDLKDDDLVSIVAATWARSEAKANAHDYLQFDPGEADHLDHHQDDDNDDDEAGDHHRDDDENDDNDRHHYRPAW